MYLDEVEFSGNTVNRRGLQISDPLQTKIFDFLIRDFLAHQPVPELFRVFPALIERLLAPDAPLPVERQLLENGLKLVSVERRRRRLPEQTVRRKALHVSRIDSAVAERLDKRDPVSMLVDRH